MTINVTAFLSLHIDLYICMYAYTYISFMHVHRFIQIYTHTHTHTQHINMTYRRGTERNLHEYLIGTTDRKRDDRKKKTSKKVPCKGQKIIVKRALEGPYTSTTGFG